MIAEIWLYGYKVCLDSVAYGPRSLTAYSAAVDWACVYYTAKGVVKPWPDCGPLAVFASLDDARRFVSRTKRLRMAKIYRCKYLPSMSKAAWAGGLRLDIERMPQGTRLASAVMLFSQVGF